MNVTQRNKIEADFAEEMEFLDDLQEQENERMEEWLDKEAARMGRTFCDFFQDAYGD